MATAFCGDLYVEPVYCPEALSEWDKYVSEKKINNNNTKEAKSFFSFRAKKHLSFLRWTFKFVARKNKAPELRYISPEGKIFASLRTACDYCIQKEESTAATVIEDVNEEQFINAIKRGRQRKSSSNDQSLTRTQDVNEELNDKRPTKAEDVIEEQVTNGKKRGRPRKYPSNDDQRPTRAEDVIEEQDSNGKKRGRPRKSPSNDDQRPPRAEDVIEEQVTNGKKGGRPRKSPSNDDQRPTRAEDVIEEQVTNGKKRGRQQKSPSNDDQRPTRAEDVIEEQVTSGKKRGRPRKSPPNDDQRPTRAEDVNEERVTNGIQIGRKLKSPSNDDRRPTRAEEVNEERVNNGIRFGRKLKSSSNDQSPTTLAEKQMIRDSHNMKGYRYDDICSICHEDGDVLLCDRCPSVFHLNCLGLEEIPNGKWFCPSCMCGICGNSQFNENKEEFTENTSSVCDQCQHEFHVGCLRRKGFTKLKACSKGNWFCSKKCEKIFVGLHAILGKSIHVENSDDNLFWTILRYNSNECCTDTMMEFHAKLNVALGIIQESFQPIREPYSNSDLIEDVVFSKGSVLNRLNFQGFYIVLLEREDEVMCVATLRVHGEKVAEVPLVATPARHRRQGMCRTLMDAIEKKLTELGVNRLILPAAQQVLDTWIDHFGFSKMMDSERKKFLSYTFLYFQKAIMCQRLLTGNHSSCKTDQAIRHSFQRLSKCQLNR
ncbi:hypothetical protein NE237_021111 [Protea cynaroides]|uniref:Uncharacterized protein n=1 Tax=Protea cynaroides TaxID=273540 RepID=A0A9Q0K2Z4_9MAGN|nr:hypothetical protein NE237_021111 [Protea cynaroides]